MPSRDLRRYRPGPRWLLCLALAAGLSLVVAACGSASASTGSGKTSFKGETLTVAVEPGTDPGVMPFYKAMATAFHKETGATLKYDYAITGTAAGLQLIDTAAASHTGPDIVELGDTSSAAAYYSNAFYTLTKSDWNELGGQNAFWPATFGDSGPSRTKDVMVPEYVDPTLMVYNKALFAKAGIAHAPTTWTQFVQDAQKINDPADGIYGTDWFPNDTQAYKAMFYFGSDYGGKVFDKGLKHATINTKPWLQALQFWTGLESQFHVVPPNTDQNTQTQFFADFANGNIGEEVASTASDEGVYEAGKIGKGFAFAPLPTIPYGGAVAKHVVYPKSMDLYEGMVIAKSAPDKALAVKYLSLLTSNKMQVMRYKLSGYMPSKQAASKTVAKIDPGLINPQITAEESAVAVPYTPAWPIFQTAIGTVTIDAGAYMAQHKNTIPNSELKSLLNQANTSIQEKL